MAGPQLVMKTLAGRGMITSFRRHAVSLPPPRQSRGASLRAGSHLMNRGRL